VDSASQGGYSWPIANWEQRYATWPVGDLATQLLGSDGMSNGYENEIQAHTVKAQACVSLT